MFFGVQHLTGLPLTSLRTTRILVCVCVCVDESDRSDEDSQQHTNSKVEVKLHQK